MNNQLGAEAPAFVEKILDYRGATILAFAQVEWFLAKIILEARVFDDTPGLIFRSARMLRNAQLW